MRIHKFWLALMLAAFVALAAACGDDDDDEAADATTPAAEATTPADDSARIGYPQEVTDDNGRAVTIPAQPEAIVALAPSFVEVLFAIGAGDAIVAADENTDQPPEAESIPRISGFEPSVEGIASYDPDLVLIFYDPGGLQDALDALSIPTVFLATPTTVQGVYDQVEKIGAIAGYPDQAEEVAAGMKSEIDAVAASYADLEGPTVFFELDPALYTVGPGSFPDEVLTLLGASNIAESTGDPYPQLSTEAVVAANPDVVILADGDFGESPETVGARPGWDVVSAVQNGKVYPVTGALLNHASSRLVDDIQTLAELLYQ